MLKPEYLTSVADSVVELYGEVEREVTADIARRIVKTGRVTETAAWQIERGQQFGLLTTDVTKTLRSSQAMGEKEIARITGEAAEKGLSFDNAIYAKAGINPLTISQSPALQSIVLQGMDDTKKLLGNFTKTLAHDVQRAYISLVDKAFLKTMTGAFDYNTAMRSAIQELVSKGITKISYPSGAAISVEAAVRRNVITGINQSVAKLQLYRAEELGCQLVEVTSHAGARPSHAEWQGKVYCISGKHKHYGDFYRETGYGTGEGLCGWNCYHSFYPFFEGLSKECEIYSAAMDACTDPKLKADLQNDLLKSSNKLRNRESALNAFLEKSGRTKDPTRVYVGGWNRNSMTTSKTRIAKQTKEEKTASSVKAAERNYNNAISSAYDKNYLEVGRTLSEVLLDIPTGSTVTSKGVIYTKNPDGDFSYSISGKEFTTTKNGIVNSFDAFNKNNAPTISLPSTQSKLDAGKQTSQVSATAPVPETKYDGMKLFKTFVEGGSSDIHSLAGYIGFDGGYDPAKANERAMKELDKMFTPAQKEMKVYKGVPMTESEIRSTSNSVSVNHSLSSTSESKTTANWYSEKADYETTLPVVMDISIEKGVPIADVQKILGGSGMKSFEKEITVGREVEWHYSKFIPHKDSYGDIDYYSVKVRVTNKQ